jgi:hypothetical protein
MGQSRIWPPDATVILFARPKSAAPFFEEKESTARSKHATEFWKFKYILSVFSGAGGKKRTAIVHTVIRIKLRG